MSSPSPFNVVKKCALGTDVNEGAWFHYLSCAIENNVGKSVYADFFVAFFQAVKHIVNKHLSYLRMWIFRGCPLCNYFACGKALRLSCAVKDNVGKSADADFFVAFF